MTNENFIKSNLAKVEERIKAACLRSGRARDEVTLIAVGKTKPSAMILKAYEAGIRDFGENRVQELTEKYGELPSDIRWHMIGHLQRNKVKYLPGKSILIHSVDSLRLAEEISRRSVQVKTTSEILIEINIAGEDSKFGVKRDEVIKLVREAAGLPGISVCGLMSVAPRVENPEENRIYFRQIKELSVDIESENIDNVSMRVLSMGMTGDYEVAIEEGATMVRVGTGIFGDRRRQDNGYNG